MDGLVYSVEILIMDPDPLLSNLPHPYYKTTAKKKFDANNICE